ncbi:MAG: 2-C-methyl-D-erythritol 4-phosphate cytidylyltransferase [Thermostichus sp. HHBFW_bins_43]
MHLLIPAAGSGKRMGATVNKLLLPLLGQSILAWTLQAADRASSIEWIGILSQPADWPAIQEILAAAALTTPVQLLQGGKTRQESVCRGVEHLYGQGTVERVLIHDGARCLATPELFDRCSAALQQVDGLIAAIPVKDTIKLTQPSAFGIQVQATPDRSKLWAAQTPQGFRLPLLWQAHQEAVTHAWEVTDDAALFEKLGWPVYIVEGEEANLKLTTPLDVLLATQILQQRLEQAY